MHFQSQCFRKLCVEEVQFLGHILYILNNESSCAECIRF